MIAFEQTREGRTTLWRRWQMRCAVVVGLIASATPFTAGALSFDPLYQKVETIAIDASLTVEPEFGETFPIERILKEAAAYVSEYIGDVRPNIAVEYKVPSAPRSPAGPEFNTLSVTIGITLREWRDPERTFEGIIGSATLELSKQIGFDPVRIGDSWIKQPVIRSKVLEPSPKDLFATASDAAELQMLVLEAVKRQLNRNVVDPFGRLPRDY